LSSIVLKIPCKSSSFHAARGVLQKPFPAATYHARQEILARVQEWTGITILLDDVAYVPLRTDWLPPRDRRTADGIEVLVDGGRPDQWPPEVQAAIEARRTGSIAAGQIGQLWEMLCDDREVSEVSKVSGASATVLPDGATVDGGPDAAVTMAAQEADAEGPQTGPGERPEAAPAETAAEGTDLNGDVQSEAPVVAEECVASVVSAGDIAIETAQDPSRIGRSPPPETVERDANAAPELGRRDRVSTVTEPVIPDAEIDRLEPGSDEFTRVVQRLEHYGAKFPSWFCEQPVETVRAGLKEAARSEKVLRAYAAEQDGIRRQRDALVAQWAIDVGVSLPDPEPAIGLEYPCTDDGNGDRLVAQYRDSIRFCKTFDAWYLWDGSRWERDETCRMLALAKRVARTIHIEASATTDDRREKVGKWALSSGMLSRLKAMITCACPAVAVTPEEFDAHPTLLNCRNGTLELDTLTFRQPRREDLLTKQAGVAYDPAAACPTWLAHLDLVFGEDTAYIEGFQELCGYSLLQENPEQIMAILYGIGKNGKSVTIGALARVWGDYAVNIAAESLMVRRNDGPRSDLARLHGARLVTASEGESRASLAESVVKQITGDDAITVRRLYENEFQFRPGAKIFLATNHEPRIRGTDEGIWRRLWLLPFTVTIPEGKRDPAILERLEAEGAGILNWCLEGLRRYQENDCRLAPPEKVLAATARFRSESDMVGRFLAQEMKTDPMGTIERTVLYKIYLKWCEDEGEKPVSNRAVIKYLRERGFGERKLGGAMCWTGIRIKSAIEEEEDATAGSVQGGL